MGTLVLRQMPELWSLGNPFQPQPQHLEPVGLAPYAAFFRRQHPRVAAAGNYMKPQVFLPSNECFALQCPTRVNALWKALCPGKALLYQL